VSAHCGLSRAHTGLSTHSFIGLLCPSPRRALSAHTDIPFLVTPAFLSSAVAWLASVFVTPTAGPRACCRGAGERCCCGERSSAGYSSVAEANVAVADPRAVLLPTATAAGDSPSGVNCSCAVQSCPAVSPPQTHSRGPAVLKLPRSHAVSLFRCSVVLAAPAGHPAMLKLLSPSALLLLLDIQLLLRFAGHPACPRFAGPPALLYPLDIRLCCHALPDSRPRGIASLAVFAHTPRPPAMLLPAGLLSQCFAHLGPPALLVQ
jgi:hypothetical protein